MEYSSIASLYRVAVQEGQGLGTAYEYYVKHRLIRKSFERVGYPKSILIAGLPEKYGYSIDFVMLADRLNVPVVVVDDNANKMDEFARVCSAAKGSGFLSDRLNMHTVLVNDWSSVHLGQMFDAAMSCGVLQRLPSREKEDYVNRLGQSARLVALFAPNAGNAAHAKITQLRTVSLSEMRGLMMNAGFRLIDSGYVDMPPLPPGLKWEGLRKPSASRKGVQSIALRLLALWSHTEKALSPLKPRGAHIVYSIGQPTVTS